MKNKLFISIYCGLMILLASCNNYLDVKPKGKIIPETAEDFSTIIHYWLDQIEKGRDDVIIPNPEVMTTLEMFADDLNATLASNFGYTSIYVGSAINKNQATYKTLYSVIKDCNMVIGNMDDTEEPYWEQPGAFVLFAIITLCSATVSHTSRRRQKRLSDFHLSTILIWKQSLHAPI